jgi:hypothetical protein
MDRDTGRETDKDTEKGHGQGYGKGHEKGMDRDINTETDMDRDRDRNNNCRRIDIAGRSQISRMKSMKQLFGFKNKFFVMNRHYCF